MVQIGFKARIKDFASIAILNRFCNELENVDVDVQRGRYVVDGKSILGLHSMDLTSGFVIIFLSHDTFTEEEIAKIDEIKNLFGIC